MKKKTAIIIALILSVSMLAGCGGSDLGFVSLYKETADLTSYTISADMEFEYDEYATYGYYYGSNDPAPLSVKLKVSGDVVITRFDDIYLNLLINYGINAKSTTHKANLLMYNNVVYMPVGDYIDYCMEAVYKLEAKYSDNLLSKIKQAFIKEFAGYDYVILTDTSELYQMAAFSGMGFYFDELMEDQKKQEELLFTAIKDMFSGLSTGMTKAVPGGYALEVTPEKAVDFYDNLIKYISKNKKTIAKRAVKLYKDLYSDNEEMAEFIPEEEEMLEYLGWIDSLEMSAWDKDYAKLLFRDSYANAQITKQGNVYSQKIDTKIFHRGKQAFTLKYAANQTVKTDIKEEQLLSEDLISMNDIDRAMERIDSAINYVKSMEITWWNWSYDDEGGYIWARVGIERLEGRSSTYIDMINESGTVYLPMRQILVPLGEEVEWDKDAKKAYVARGEEKIYMEGLLRENTTYVKVRDLEKLGYKVNYEYEKDDWGYGNHKITIKR